MRLSEKEAALLGETKQSCHHVGRWLDRRALQLMEDLLMEGSEGRGGREQEENCPRDHETFPQTHLTRFHLSMCHCHGEEM